MDVRTVAINEKQPGDFIMQDNLQIKSVLNFRDIGGARLAGGKHIRRGVIYRSADPGRISREDIGKIKALNIRTIVDLRALSEVKGKTKIPEGIEKISMPLDFEEATKERLLPHIRKRGSFKEIDEVVRSLYIEMLDASVPVFRQVVKLLLSDERRPLLLHCRAGKDRTGIIIALIHLALAAERESIIDDYIKSNESLIPYFKKRLLLRKIISLGRFPSENVLHVLEVKKENIELIIDRVNNHYGGIESYFDPAAKGSTDLIKLREIIVTD